MSDDTNKHLDKEKDIKSLSEDGQINYLCQQMEIIIKSLSELRQTIDKRFDKLENNRKRNTINDFKLALDIINSQGFFTNDDFNSEDFKEKYEDRGNQYDFRRNLLSKYPDLTSFKNTNEQGSPIWICKQDNLEEIMRHAKVKPKKNKQKNIGKETDIQKISRYFIEKLPGKNISVNTIYNELQIAFNMRDKNAKIRMIKVLTDFGTFTSVGSSRFIVSKVMPQ